VASAVSITGTPNVGQTLTGHYTYSDANSDLEGTSTFRWLLDGTPIAGATASTYTVLSGDQGKTLKFEVTPVAATGTSPGTPVQSAGVVVNSAPVASAVSITGTANVGNTLSGTYTYGDVDSDAQGTSTFRWLLDGTLIAGATGSTYTVLSGDQGKTLKFEVTPVALTGTSPGTAVQSTGVVVNSAPVASAVSITGAANVGQTLTGTYSYNDVDGDAQGTSTFRWLRDGTPIAGATASTYTVLSCDQGKTLKFDVNPVASGQS